MSHINGHIVTELLTNFESQMKTVIYNMSPCLGTFLNLAPYGVNLFGLNKSPGGQFNILYYFYVIVNAKQARDLLGKAGFCCGTAAVR